MRGSKVGMLVIAVLAVVFVAGCAKAPEAELESAKAAVESARASGADRYVPDVYKAAQDSLNAAVAEIEAQGSKFTLTRNYKKALPLLDAASRLAAEAEAGVAGKKEEIKAETQKLAGEAKAALDEAKRLVRRAPRGKEGRAALDAIQGELKAVETSLDGIPAMIEKEDFVNARDRARAALTKTRSIIEELRQAIAKKS